MYQTFKTPTAERARRTCSVGKVLNTSKAENAITVQCYAPVSDGRLRLRWVPLFLQDGRVMLETGTEVYKETVPVKHVICVALLNSGVLSHAIARRLDQGNYVFDQKEFRYGPESLSAPVVRTPNFDRLETLCGALCDEPTVGSPQRSVTRAVPAPGTCAGSQMGKVHFESDMELQK